VKRRRKKKRRKKEEKRRKRRRRKKLSPQELDLGSATAGLYPIFNIST
jgi:hypothetical protein